MNILLVSIAFPPKRDPESVQVARYFSALTKIDGARVDVVTSPAPAFNMPIDEGLRHYVRGCRQLVEVKFFQSRYLEYAMTKLCPGLLARPDPRYGFWRNWKSVIGALDARPDVIYSRAFPLSSALMAYQLARHYDVPWVLHLSDPWTLSPLHSIAAAARWNEEAEAKCFAQAAAITFTSRKTVDVYARKYPQYAGKFEVFPNVYERDSVAANPWTRGPRLRLVYTGSLMDTRSPAPVIAAMQRLKSLRPDVHADIEVTFAGIADRRNAALLAQNTAGIQYLGEVALDRAIAQQRQADVLLLIDSAFGDPDSAMFFPSKLLDYVVAQRRTIAITDEESTTWQVVGQLGLGDRVAHHDVDGLCRAFVQAWEAWKTDDRSYFDRTALAPQFESRWNAERLMGVFRSVTQVRGLSEASGQVKTSAEPRARRGRTRDGAPGLPPRRTG